MALRNLRSVLVIMVLAGLTACGGSNKKYLIPVDAPQLKPFASPDSDEVGDDDGNWDDEGEGEDAEPEPVAKPKPVAKPRPAAIPDATTAKKQPASVAIAPKPVAKPAPRPAPANGDRVAMGAIAISGQYSKDTVRSALREKINTFRACYERELTRSPSLAGTVRVTFHIQLDGSVKDVASSGMAVVDACVGKAIGAMKFAQPAGRTVRVTTPFAFAPTFTPTK